jgi:hypothetical protein
MTTDEKRTEVEAEGADPITPASTALSPNSDSNSQPPSKSQSQSLLRRIWTILTWMPPWCRWDPNQPPVFSMSMNVLFAFAGGFTVANLYYSHPILNILAAEFDVNYEQVAQIPTVMRKCGSTN